MASRTELSARRVGRIVRRFPDEVARRMKTAFREDGDEWLATMSRTRFNAPLPGPGNTNRVLHNRTGALRRSLGRSVTGRDVRTLRMRVFSSGVPYARIQEFGGEVVPRTRRWLTIPLPDNMTPAGVTRETAPLAIMHGAFFFKSKTGKLLIAKREGDRLRFLFVLKKRVRIPAGRLGFFDTWDRLRPSRVRRHRKALAMAVRDARMRARG